MELSPKIANDIQFLSVNLQSSIFIVLSDFEYASGAFQKNHFGKKSKIFCVILLAYYH